MHISQATCISTLAFCIYATQYAYLSSDLHILCAHMHIWCKRLFCIYARAYCHSPIDDKLEFLLCIKKKKKKLCSKKDLWGAYRWTWDIVDLFVKSIHSPL